MYVGKIIPRCNWSCPGVVAVFVFLKRLSKFVHPNKGREFAVLNVNILLATYKFIFYSRIKFSSSRLSTA